MPKSPAQTDAWLSENGHRLDMPQQYIGTEPNAARRPWDTATARWCLLASWPYEAAAGNQSIPAVYKAIHDHDDTFLCDRFYLPATPGDLKLLDKNGLGAFGIESKHPLLDFDAVGSSISYPVLAMSFLKLLTMSGITPRWRDREARGEVNDVPMVVAGGLSYGAPEVLAPVVDCWFLGEVEDEPGNPGIGAITHRIAAFKRLGRWTTDRVGCYADLAREFNFLYFPRFVNVLYSREDRSHVGVGPHMSKQVTGYTSNLPGMRLPLRKRHVKDLDAIKPLDNPPLLFVDPAMGSGDLEVARSCPCWCSFCSLCLSGETEFVTRNGPRRIDSMVGQSCDVWTEKGWSPATVSEFGRKPLNKITFAPADFGGFGSADTCRYGHSRADDVHSPGVQAGRTAKLTMEKADEIRRRYAAGGVSQAQLANEFGIQSPTVCLIVNNKAWVDRPKKPGISGHNCRTCNRIKAKNRYYLSTGRPELVVELQEVIGWKRERGWRRLSRPSMSVTVYATADHRWPLVDGTETHHLAVGNFVKGLAVAGVEDQDEVDRGFVHGLVFGDGCEMRRTQAGRVFRLDLFGKKYAHENACRVEKFLEAGLNYTRDAVSGVSVRRFTDPLRRGTSDVLRREVRLVTDVAMKEFPGRGSSPDYMRGFLQGWIATDGTASDGPDSVEIGSQDPGARVWLDRYAASAGWVLIGDCVNSVQKTNFGSRSNALHSFTLTRAEKIGWKVMEIEDGVREESVFCATVPGEGFFLLASGVYTGNSWKSKPYRQRSIPYVIQYAKTLQSNMGSTRMAPFSPDLPMYTQRRELIANLLEEVSDEVDAPSMRVDDFNADETFVLLQVHGGMDSVSLGVEGNSQRMRDLIGKGTSDNDVKEAVAKGIRAGIRKFKLFMISNLPGEDEGDVYRILKLAKDLADIRDSMNQPTVRIQFSWTPLIIEANTPMQWFAPQPASRILGDVWEEFRALKIDSKLGAKSEPNKLAFFQLIQRASRDVGEALVDAMLEVDQACWGGVPRTFADTIEKHLHRHGFANGFADCFDERFRHDMFGWEFIDTGISADLMWRAYVQMREFAELTDSSTYDLNFGDEYHGSEWLARCDQRCYGKSCGNCDYDDLKLRNNYMRAQDSDIDLTTISPVDQHSQAVRIRAHITKSPDLRFVGNDHWRYLLRRAFFRAHDRLNPTWAPAVAKRSIRFASDEVKYRDWASGCDYVEFAFTRPVTDDQISAFLFEAGLHTTGRLTIGGWRRHPVNAVTIRHDVGSVFYSVALDADITTATTRLAAFTAADNVPMRLKVEGGYFAPTNETVNAKDYVNDIWLLPVGHTLLLRMLVKGRPNPYNIAAAVMGKQSWLPYAKNHAERIDVFINTDRHQQDFLRPTCEQCSFGIPINMLDQPYDTALCPRCLDRKEDDQ